LKTYNIYPKKIVEDFGLVKCRKCGAAGFIHKIEDDIEIEGPCPACYGTKYVYWIENIVPRTTGYSRLITNIKSVIGKIRSEESLYLVVLRTMILKRIVCLDYCGSISRDLNRKMINVYVRQNKVSDYFQFKFSYQVKE
jgi:hypothetical protein